MLQVVLPLLAAGGVALLGPWAVRVSARQGMFAPHDEDRHIHTRKTPHGGGFLLPLVVVPLGLVAVWTLGLPFRAFLTALLLTSLLVAWVGWKDDHAHIDPSIRLAVHLGAVTLGLMFLPQLFDFMPVWIEKLLLLLAWGWFVNLYNFMDGADGLATSEAVFLSLAIGLLVPPFAPLALVVAAAGLGFLRVNRPPARVFMGDVCSTWLGYTLGGILLVCLADDTWTYIWPLAAITLVFCGDATSTLIRRILQGHKPWEPHKTFWFHRFLALGNTHAGLLRAVVGLNIAILLCSSGFLWAGLPVFGFVFSLLAVMLAACYIRRHESSHK